VLEGACPFFLLFSIAFFDKKKAEKSRYQKAKKRKSFRQKLTKIINLNR